MVRPDESWISYCGLYCGDCLIYKGEIADLAKLLLRKFKEIRFLQVAERTSELANKFKSVADFNRFCDALCMLDSLRCAKICKEGGGSNLCKIRKCCVKKNISGCWLCDDFEDCRVLIRLKPNHIEEHIRILKRIREIGLKQYVEELTSSLESVF